MNRHNVRDSKDLNDYHWLLRHLTLGLSIMLQRGDEPIPGYKLEKFLGKGTFGEVWRATGQFGVKVALKFIDISGKAGLKEFRGIQRVKDIRNAHLMPITAIWMLDSYNTILDDLDVADLERPEPDVTATMSLEDVRAPRDDTRRPNLLVVAMTLADSSLGDRMEECVRETGEGIPVLELLDYMEQAARGLDFLNLKEHDIGDSRSTIQHCDVKPDNMMLVGDSVVICDFGLAQLLGDTQKTNTGMLGTPAYIAPEVLITQRPCPTTDQYSFACSYFHLRTGRLPFDSTSSLPAVFEIVKAGRLDFNTIKGSSERAVIKKATSTDPNKRYNSNLEFVRELRKAVDDDRRLDEELAGDKVKRYLKYVAILVVLAALLGGAGVLIAMPKLRVQLVAKVRDAFGNGNSTSTTGTGQTPGGRGERPPFESVIRVAERDFSEDEWASAFQTVREFEQTYPDETKVKRREYVDKLLERANSTLNTAPAESIAQSAAVLADIESRPGIDAAVEVQTRLTLARGLGRNGQWSEAEIQLKRIEAAKNQLDAVQQFVYLALQILKHTADDRTKFFDDEVLQDMGRLGNRLTETIAPWEARQVAMLKADAFQLLQAKKVNVDLNDPRIMPLFDVEILKTLAMAESTLTSGSADKVHWAELRQRLDEAVRKSEGGPNQGQATYWRAFLELRDVSVPLAKALGLIPEEIMDRDQLRRLAELLLDRCESLMATEQLTPAMLKTADRVATRARQLMGSPADSLVARAQALAVLNRLWTVEFDPAATLTDCEQIRRLRVTLPANIDACLQALWAECQLVRLENKESVGASDYRELTEAIKPIGTAKMSGIGEFYCQFVRARAAAQNSGEGRVNAIETLQPLLSQKPMPAFMLADNRKQFVGGLLVTAADAMRSGGDSQIEKPAYVAERADQALTWMRIAAAEFGANNENLKRNLVLANFYGSRPDFAQAERFAASFDLSPTKREDGQLLLVRAVAGSKLPSIERSTALASFANLFEWDQRFSESRNSQWEFYQSVVAPALKLAQQFPIENFGDRSRSIVLDKIRPADRPFLGRIFGTSARIVQEDFDTPRNLFPNSEQLAVVHRYFNFRAAAALDTKNIDYLVGQYWALQEWADLDQKTKLNELTDLAEAAFKLDKSNLAANGIRGETLVARSRLETDAAKRKRYLEEAITLFGVALAGNDPGLEENYLYVRSTANVELAYLIDCSEEKIGLLKQAVSDAQRASRFRFARQPQNALIAWGNAAEDLAYYCHQEMEKNHSIALSQFASAVQRARAGSKSYARLCLGRCRYRRAAQAWSGQFKPNENLDLDAETLQAVAELKLAAEETNRNDYQAEANFWASQTYQLRMVLAKSDSDKNAANKASQEHLQAAIAASDRLSWENFQWAWARIAYLENDYDGAKSRAQQIVDERNGTKYTVHWEFVYRALLIQFLATPPNDRAALITAKLSLLPENDATALPYRVRWLLLFPSQLFPISYLAESGYPTDSLLVDAADQHDFARYEQLTTEALHLAESNRLPASEAAASGLQAIVKYYLWEKGKDVGTRAAAAEATDRATKVICAQPDFGGLSSDLLGFCFYGYGAVYGSLKDSSLPVGERTRLREKIKNEVIPRLEQFLNNPEANDAKRYIGMQLSDLKRFAAS